MADANPLLTPSTLPYALPPFADIRPEHYREAFERGFAEQRAELEAITGCPDAPTAANTVIALEASGRLLRRVSAVFYNRSSADSDPFTRELEEEIAPLMAEHGDRIRLDPVLYERIAALQAAPAEPDPETALLIERYHVSMTKAGAGLDESGKERLREYNRRLSSLTVRFEKNLLADTNDLAVVVDDEADLEGLGRDEIASAAAAAAERGLEGYLIPLVLPTGHPYLARLSRPVTRERIMDASRSRGIRGGENDNRALVLEITRVRAERAELLGFASHAAYVTADQTARTPENVAELLHRLAPAAARNARTEHEALQHAAGAEVGASDWAYYAEQVRLERFDVDTASMRPYFEAERVLRDGVFFAASALYGLVFTERPDLVGYHPGVRVFEVTREDGSAVGLYLLDLYTRDSKRGGAWMNSLVSQSGLLGVDTSVVVNNLNVPKPPPGEPTLLTFDLVTTLFHEFGHALHGLLAHVTYPRFSGTSVHRDFVEFPSQVNEMWMLWPEVLRNYAVHHETGEPMPQHVVDRLVASRRFGEGFATSEYLAAALLDQAWHALSAADDVDDVAAFEASALAAAGLDHSAVPPRYASTYFAHTFSGGYDAGYYSYIWSEVLDADCVEWFTENGGLTRENGERFGRLVLGIGGSREPLAAYREFRGRDALIEPLLRRRGLLAE
jgi:peptidyl-dipeptidase Dcp